MTTHDLAAALEREACGHACQCTGCNNIRLAAQRLRELEAVRVAAATYAYRTSHCEEFCLAGDYEDRECLCGHNALRTALGRVGGGT